MRETFGIRGESPGLRCFRVEESRGLSIIGEVFTYLGAKEEADAAEHAADANQELAEDAALAQQEGAAAASSYINNAMPRIQENLSDAYTGAESYLDQGFGGARNDLLQAGDLSAGAVTQGQFDSLSSLYDGANQGAGYLSGAQQNVDQALQTGITGANQVLGEQLGTQGISAYDVTGSQDRAGAMLDREGGIYGGFENDPGYQYRLQQSEQAIMRSAAARGGRMGGATLKALQENAIGLAGQSYNDFAAHRMNEYGAASNSDAARAGLNMNQAGRADAAAQSGAQNRFNAAGQLAGYYNDGAHASAGAAQSLGSQAAGMAQATGMGAANIHGQAAGSLADIYGQTGTALANESMMAGQSMAGNLSDYYSGLSDIELQRAGMVGNFVMSGAGGQMQALPALTDANNSTVQYQGLGWKTVGASVGDAEDTAAMLLASQSGG